MNDGLQHKWKVKINRRQQQRTFLDRTVRNTECIRSYEGAAVKEISQSFYEIRGLKQQRTKASQFLLLQISLGFEFVTVQIFTERIVHFSHSFAQTVKG